MNNAILLILFVLSCFYLLTTDSAYAQEIKEIGFVERGKASYYPDDRNGAVTRSGEKYDMYELAGAHPSIAFGSLVRVKNLDNAKEVVIRINDRPYTKDRVLDLTYASAEQLGMLGKVSTDIKLEVIALNVPRATYNTKGSPLSMTKLVANNETVEKTPITDPQDVVEKEPETDLREKFSPVNTYQLDGTPIKLNGFGIQIGAFSEIDKALELANEFNSIQFKHVVIQSGWSASKKEYRVLFGQFPTKEAATPALTFLRKTKTNAFVRSHFE